jgi:hypothetical protein
MSKLVQNIKYVKIYLDDLLILTNRNRIFKVHLLNLEIVLARLLTIESLGWGWKFPNLTSLQNK